MREEGKTADFADRGAVLRLWCLFLLSIAVSWISCRSVLVLYVPDCSLYHRCLPGKGAGGKSFIRLGTYVTMFPQLIAGPIINYSEVRMALCSRTVTFEQFESGLKTLILGLGAKVIVADRIGLLWNNIQAIGFESISTPLAWMGAFAYSIELYFDFSGYSLMALGLGRMLGFEFPKTLNIPIFQDRYPNSGEDGILRLDAGSGNMSIFRLAATGREKRVRYLIYLWYGVLLPSGMGQRDIF